MSVNYTAAWERAMPLPTNAPARVVAARNAWYFHIGIFAPLSTLMQAYAKAPNKRCQTTMVAQDLAVCDGDPFWDEGDDYRGFVIHSGIRSLQGLDAMLVSLLPDRSDEHTISFYPAKSYVGAFFVDAFAALGSYIQEVYPEVGNTRYAREDGLDYRVLASLAGHGVDPTDNDWRNPELSRQWEECQKDTLVLGAFAALQRLGELINELFPEKPKGGAE